VKAERGTPHGGVYLDIASRLPAEEIKRRLPSMYHQFMELAEVDITKEPMEVGPTCHYVMGGIEVDPDTGAAKTPGLFAAGECSGGMHGSNRLGGNSLSDLLVFGRRAGLGASDYVRALADRPTVSEEAVAEAAKLALAPFDGPTNGDSAENPYTLQLDLQDTMNNLVGIIRRADEVTEALEKLTELRERFKRVQVEGHRQFNPGWHLALDLRNMLIVSECTAKAALEREESRGGHTREDFPQMSAEWRKVNLVCALGSDGDVHLERKPLPRMRDELFELFDRSELAKYVTEEELSQYPANAQSKTEAK
jgi:succinate dehydrogenase / fumarate reductase, flavoprotein subunit